MPNYEFINEDESEYNIFFFEMKSAPPIGGIFTDESGQKWKRIPSMPQAATSIEIDPFDSKAFVEKTGRMKGNYGNLLDYSAEMSARRAAKNNSVDPIKENYFESRKKLTGLEHPEVKKRKAKENLAKKGIILE